MKRRFFRTLLYYLLLQTVLTTEVWGQNGCIFRHQIAYDTSLAGVVISVLLPNGNYSCNHYIVSGETDCFGKRWYRVSPTPTTGFAYCTTVDITTTSSDGQVCTRSIFLRDDDCFSPDGSTAWNIDTSGIPAPQAVLETLPISINPDTLRICAGQTVQFSNNSVNANACLWDFGNGNYSSQGNSIQTYAQPGTYAASLIAQANLPLCNNPDTVITITNEEMLVISEYKLYQVSLQGQYPCSFLDSGLNEIFPGEQPAYGTLVSNSDFADTICYQLSRNIGISYIPNQGFVGTDCFQFVAYMIDRSFGNNCQAGISGVKYFTVQVNVTMPEGNECYANAGQFPLWTWEADSIIVNYNTANHQLYAVFDIDGNMIDSSTSLPLQLYEYTPESERLVAINYADGVVLNNTLQGIYLQIANGECIDAQIYEEDCFLGWGGEKISVHYNQELGGYTIQAVMTNYISEISEDAASIYNIQYGAGEYSILDTWGYAIYEFVDANGQPFPLGSAVSFYVLEYDIFCEISVIIPSELPTTPPPPPPTSGDPLTQVGTNNLSDTTHLVIVVSPNPALDIACRSVTCPGRVETYTTSAVCTDYNWLVLGSNILSGQGTASVSVYWENIADGTLFLNVGNCDTTYCSPQTSLNIPILSSDLTMAGNTQPCANAQEIYTMPYYNGATYQWSILPANAGNIIGGQGTNSALVRWNTTGTLSCTIEHQMLTCAGNASLPVVVTAAFTVSAEEITCIGQAVSFETSVPGTFDWSVVGGEILSGQGSSSIEVASNGLGNIVATATILESSIFCNSTATASSPSPPPVPETAITGQTTVCLAQTYTYQAAPDLPALTWTWTATNGTIVGGQGTESVQVVWDNTPSHSLSAQPQHADWANCPINLATIEITNIDSDSFEILTNDATCMGSKNVFYIAPSLYMATFEWQLLPPDAGEIVSGQGSDHIEVQWHPSATQAVISATYCGQTASLALELFDVPNPHITQSDTLCTAGMGITLSVEDTGGQIYTSYIWQSSSNIVLSNSPTVAINAESYYSVTVTNADGCTSIGRRKVEKYLSPVPNIYGLYDGICIETPQDIVLQATDGTHYSFSWQANGVPQGITASPYYIHSGDSILGTYFYQLIVEDTLSTCTTISPPHSVTHNDCIAEPCFTCPDPEPPTDTIPPPIGSGPICVPPVGMSLSFVISIGQNCNDIIITPTVSGNFTSLSLYLDDGTPLMDILGQTSILHTYPNMMGLYNIVIRGTYIGNDGQTCYIRRSKAHSIPMLARFDTAEGCPGEITQFFDRSVYLPGTTIQNYTWDFGDGSPMVTGTNAPQHVYQTGGTYIARLILDNDTCLVEHFQQVHIPNIPEGSFSLATAACVGSEVLFMPSDATGLEYLWTFGDGDSATLQNPTHIYGQIGDYTATLQLTNAYGCRSEVFSNLVQVVNGAAPQAISVSDTSFCVGETTWLSAAVSTSYLWNTGETTQTIAASNSGEYWVETGDVSGCISRSNLLNLSALATPNANILPNGDTLRLCQGNANMQVALQNNCIYEWSNGQTSHAVTASDGAWYVSVTNTATGCSALSDTVQVLVQSSPTVSVSSASLAACQGDTVNLHAVYDEGLSSLQWSNGSSSDGISVLTSGVYGVTLTDGNGCRGVGSASVQIHGFPNAIAFPTGCYELCAGESIGFPASALHGSYYYQWFLNGEPIAGANNGTYEVQAAGAYHVAVSNFLGCTSLTEPLFVTLEECPVLPVSLISFSGEVRELDNLLHWQTASEHNASHFTVHRSSDGIRFEQLNRVSAAGNSNSLNRYSSVDTQPFATTYYKLTQTDFDGKEREYETIVLRRNNVSNALSIHAMQPMPVSGVLEVVFDNPSGGAVQAVLFDVLGRKVRDEQHEASTGINRLYIDMNKFSNGVYLLQLNNGAQSVAKKVMVGR